MGLTRKVIGMIMILIGIFGVITRVPDLFVSALVDNINPLAQFGIIVPFIGTVNNSQSLLIYIIVSFLIILIGIILVAGGNNNSRVNLRR